MKRMENFGFNNEIDSYIELQNQNKMLLETIKSRDILFSILSHDLMSPIGGILSLSKYLSKNADIQDIDVYKECFTTINFSLQKVNEILINMMEYSKFNLIDPNLEYESLNIYNLINETLEFLDVNIKSKKITVIVNITDSFEIYSNKIRNTSILRNLISNAIKFSYESSRIEIGIDTYSENKEFGIVTIKDYGVGMDEEKVNNILLNKLTSPQKGTSKEQGVGIGLMLTKEIINLNSGEIWVESETSKGSTFFVTFKKKENNILNIYNLKG